MFMVKVKYCVNVIVIWFGSFMVYFYNIMCIVLFFNKKSKKRRIIIICMFMRNMRKYKSVKEILLVDFFLI